MRERARRAVGVVVALAAIGAVALLVARLQRPPSGPVDVVWDKETCTHCRMLIGDPSFAAQIQTSDGRVLDFDDPGCLFAYEAASHPSERAVYFHELRGPRWLPRDRTAFLPGQSSPMGYGFGAVEVGTPGAISYDDARARVLAAGGAVSHGAP